MAIVGVELETLVSEPDALTTRPPPCANVKPMVFNKEKAGFSADVLFPNPLCCEDK